MKTYGGVDVKTHGFLTSAIIGGEWSASPPGRVNPATQWVGVLMGSEASLDDMEKRKLSLICGNACKVQHILSDERLPFSEAKEDMTAD
jgi:hypothetical protein